MCRILVGLALALIAAVGFAGEAPSTRATVLRHVTIVDVASGRLVTDRDVSVVGGRIASVDAGGAASLPAGGRSVDAQHEFLIPGLWDMHVHTVFGDWIPPAEHLTLPLFVANGITGVRDMGGDLPILKRWRADIAAGRLLGPRMVIAGPMLDGPVPRFPSSAPVGSAADGRRVVEDLVHQGVDFIKIQSLIPRDGYFAAADTAKRLGITFVGHVPDAVRASEASEAGQRSI